jgi:phosphoacetylglucosamine mutase
LGAFGTTKSMMS